MKQGRLSFSTKRKDRDIQDEDCKDVITINDSPQKPPPKKICRDPNEAPLLNNAKVVKSSDPTPLTDNVSSPSAAKVSQEHNDVSSSASADDNETTLTQDVAADEKSTTETDASEPSDKTNQEKPEADVSNDDESTTTRTEVSESIDIDSESNSDADDEMDVSTAESSVLNSTLESTADEGDTPQEDDSETTPKRSRLSKTEAAYQRLKQRKDKQLRQKEKEDRLKLKQEERERREQEKKELKERREKERLEKERKREEERLSKEKERIEKERKREEERLEKEKEKEEKEKLRKEKEDEKRRREEDKKRELEEEIAKKEKAKQAFRSFFVKKTHSKQRSTKAAKVLDDDNDDDGGADQSVGRQRESAAQFKKFRPFQLKKDMKLARIVPENAKTRFDKAAFELAIKKPDNSEANLYVQQLKHGYEPLRFNNNNNSNNHKNKNNNNQNKNNNNENKNNNNENDDDDDNDNKTVELVDPEDLDVIIINRSPTPDDESTGGRMRAKLLQFVENYRPAYYGTWRKKCPQINGRRPFSKYSDFDYTIDSDDEWEEGEGESLMGTDDEKEDKDEVEEDYEEDDFLVPHGYLSESEEDEEDDQPMDPEALKARIVARQEEFKADRKAGLQKKKIVAVCSLGPKGISLQEELKVLAQFKAVLMVANGLKPSWEREPDVVINTKDSEPAVLSGKALEVFCKTAHGFKGGVRQMYDLFIQKWRAVSDVSVSLKSLKMTLTTCCKKSKSLNALVVNNHLVDKFGLEKLEIEQTGDGASSSKYLPSDVIPELIKVTQGNSKTSQILEDFLALMPNRKFGKAQVKRTLTAIGEFDHVLRCWLVKEDCLKEHGLEELKIVKANKKEQVKEEKFTKAKDSTKSKEDKKLKDDKLNRDAATGASGATADDVKNCNKENDDVDDVNLAAESPRADCSTPSSITTPKRVSIKSFFTPKSRATTATPSTTTPSTTTPSTTTTTTDEVSTTPTNSKRSNDVASVRSVSTPKAKKRVQLTTLSRTPTLKEENKSQSVLDKEEVIHIDDSN